MATVISTMAKKGGVGKSTIAWSISATLAAQGYRVIIIDCDHQSSLSQILFGSEVIEAMPMQHTVAALFDDVVEPELDKILHPTSDPNILIVPANDTLQPFAAPNPRELGDKQFVYREFVAEIADSVDYIVIDTPPDCANLLTWNALMASHHVLSVVAMEPMSVQSIAGTFRKISEAISSGNRDLQFLGMVINLVDMRRALHKGYIEEIRNLYGSQVFDTIVKANSGIGDACQKQQHIFQFQPKGEGAKMIRKLGKELLEKINTSSATRRAA